jgi:hypothetical protein
MSKMKKDPDANWKVVMVKGKGTAFRTWASHMARDSEQIRRFDSDQENH